MRRVGNVEAALKGWSVASREPAPPSRSWPVPALAGDAMLLPPASTARDEIGS
jgi:hypothetical protein